MSLITEVRLKLHTSMLKQGILCRCPLPPDKRKQFGEDYIASNGDSGQKFSTRLSNNLLKIISQNSGEPILVPSQKPSGQTLGNQFEELCSWFLQETFPRLDTLRPGQWIIQKSGTRTSGVIGNFEQYTHLAELNRLADQNTELKNFLGDGYTIAPDVIIARLPESDASINIGTDIVDDHSAKQSKLRAKNHEDEGCPRLLLHASISCKFTMRSDRSQNTRTEALNLIRSRKGRVPHIVAVTIEPTPSRIASLALGTGDLDCVYHLALYELIECLQSEEDASSLDMLKTMIDGKRLKDISDLPLDLCI